MVIRGGRRASRWHGGRWQVCCALVVVALVGSRGHSSPKGGAALALMVYITVVRARW